MRIANIVAAIIGMLFSVAAFLKTLTFKKFTNVPVGPDFFPQILAAGLFICCLILLIVNIINKKDKSKAPTISPLDKDMQKCLAGLAVIVLYAVLWNILGFLIITPPVLFAMMFILGQRNYKTMVIVSICATVIIFCAFKFLLHIEMPLGFLDGML